MVKRVEEYLGISRKRKAEETSPETNPLLREIKNLIDKDNGEKLIESIHKNTSKIDLNTKFKSERCLTFLEYSCMIGSIKCAEVLLIEHGRRVTPTNYTRTALEYTCKNGQLDMLKFLVTQFEVTRTDVCNLFKNINTLNNMEMVRILIDRSILSDGPIRNTTILHQACMTGGTEAVSYLLEKGVNIHKLTYDNRDALYSAAKNGHHAIVKILLEYRDKTNETAENDNKISILSINQSFIIACTNFHTQVVRILIDYGADVNSYTMIGYYRQTVLTHAFNHITTSNLADILINNGADLTLCDTYGVPLLIAAVKQITATTENTDTTHNSDHLNIIKTLLLHGININLITKDTDETALMIAVIAMRYDIVKILLEFGADVTPINRAGKTVFDLLGRTRKTGPILDLCQEYIDTNVQLDQPLMK